MNVLRGLCLVLVVSYAPVATPVVPPAGAPSAPRPAAPTPLAARAYVRVGTPRVVLAHVEVIVGTGAPPRPNQNVTLVNGTIASITPGADEAPTDGTTVLDLRGHAVLPGIVGMHDHLW